jgi:hypothetical protein
VRGQNKKTVYDPPYCPLCRVELTACGEEVDGIVARLRGEDHLGFSSSGDEHWTAQCETFNCFHGGRNADRLMTIFLVTTEREDWSFANYDSDVDRAIAEPIGSSNEDGVVGLYGSSSDEPRRRRTDS